MWSACLTSLPVCRRRSLSEAYHFSAKHCTNDLGGPDVSVDTFISSFREHTERGVALFLHEAQRTQALSSRQVQRILANYGAQQEALMRIAQPGGYAAAGSSAQALLEGAAAAGQAAAAPAAAAGQLPGEEADLSMWGTRRQHQQERQAVMSGPSSTDMPPPSAQPGPVAEKPKCRLTRGCQRHPNRNCKMAACK